LGAHCIEVRNTDGWDSLHRAALQILPVLHCSLVRVRWGDYLVQLLCGFAA
jgi:hypothetical protein